MQSVFIVLGIYNFGTTVFLRQNQSMFALVLVSRNLCAIKPTFVVILSTYTHGTELELGAILCQITTWFCQFIFSLRWYFRFLLVCFNFRKKLKFLSTLPFPVRNEILSNILFHFCFSFVFGQKVGFDKIVILFQISSASIALFQYRYEQ